VKKVSDLLFALIFIALTGSFNSGFVSRIALGARHVGEMIFG
jgi:hypothetical protein